MEIVGYGAIILIVLFLLALVPWGLGEFHRTTNRERAMSIEREEYYKYPLPPQD